MNIIEHEVSPQRWIDIPEEVLKIYTIWRPTPGEDGVINMKLMEELERKCQR